MTYSLKVVIDISNELKAMLTSEQIRSLSTDEGKERYGTVLQDIYEDSVL